MLKISVTIYTDEIRKHKFTLLGIILAAFLGWLTEFIVKNIFIPENSIGRLMFYFFAVWGIVKLVALFYSFDLNAIEKETEHESDH